MGPPNTGVNSDSSISPPRWYFALNNRRLWVLKRCREEGLLLENNPHKNLIRVRVRTPKSQAETARYTVDKCALQAKVMKESTITPKQQQQPSSSKRAEHSIQETTTCDNESDNEGNQQESESSKRNPMTDTNDNTSSSSIIVSSEEDDDDSDDNDDDPRFRSRNRFSALMS